VCVALGFPFDVLWFCLQKKNLFVGLCSKRSFKDEVCEISACGLFLYRIMFCWICFWNFIEQAMLKLQDD
jgi:hypothetical protein